MENGKDSLKMTLRGESISMQDAVEFKKQLSLAVSKNSPAKLVVCIEDAYALPSSVIGALLKYKEIEKIEVELIAKKAELMDSLENLALAEILHARAY
jgi:hypothetical protein